MRGIFRAAGFLYATLLAAQPPAITQEGVFNAASRMPPSLPGGALAPGSRFIIEGLRFEAGSQVRINGQSVQVLSAEPSRIEALLPKMPAPGNGAIVVTNRDGASRPFEVRIVPASLGLYSANDKSWGPAKMERPYVLTGTGLGGVTHPEILVGGKRAQLLRAGPRAGEPGIDEIEFIIPEGTPQGCYVPVLARIPGGPVSNTVAVRVGRCEEPRADATALLMLMRLMARIRTYSHRDLDTTQDLASAMFAPAPVIGSLLNTWRLRPPAETCTAYTGPFFGSMSDVTVPAFFGGVIGSEGRDEGASVTLRGAKRNALLPEKSPGYYHAAIGGGKFLSRPELPLVLSPGAYTLSWRSGSAKLNFPGPFSWTNMTQIDIIDRASGITLEWKAGGSPMAILAVSVDTESTAMGAAVCIASGSRFHIPAESLANLPASPPEPGLPYSLLILAPLRDLEYFQTGDTRGVALVTTVRALSVAYK